MDWREFFKGFFGGHRRSSEPDVWPPAPPIRDLFENGGNENEGSNSGRIGPHNHFDNHWGRDTPPSKERFGSVGGGGPGGPTDIGDVHDFPGREFGGNRFVFGNMFSIMGEAMQEVDRAMREMDRMFGDIRIGGQFGAFPPDFRPPSAPNLGKMLPPPGIPPSSALKSPPDDSVRDFVLKEPDSSKSPGRHYITPPKKSEEKVDRDLDDLYNKSMLDLSELPVPSGADKRKDETGTAHPQDSRIVPFGFGFRGGNGGSDDGNFYSHSYQKTYQTYTFKNGKWEGEKVTEDANGKSVTRYFQDENGQKQEVTEYYPRGSDSSGTLAQLPHQNEVIEPEPPHRHDFERPNDYFNFFDQLFRPRM